MNATTAPAIQTPMRFVVREVHTVYTAESAWETQASWHRGRFGAKPASHGFAVGTPKRSDFAPGKVGDI